MRARPGKNRSRALNTGEKTMAMMTHEEHARRQRRRWRQLLGLVVCLLVIVGICTVLSRGVETVGGLFDNSALKQDLESRLQCYVMLDPLPFDSLDQADPNQIKEYAIWTTVNNALATAGSLDAYERDPDTDGIILPTLEVDAAIARLFGPDYKVEHATFENSDMNFLYLEDKQGYLIPVTGQIGQYTPQVENIKKSQGNMYVTVGYIPTFTNSTFVFSAATEPTKYMDYVFAKNGKNWYMTSLQESETKPASSVPVDVNDQNAADVDYDPAAVLQESINSEAAASGAGSEPGDPEDTDAEDTGEEDGSSSSEG